MPARALPSLPLLTVLFGACCAVLFGVAAPASAGPEAKTDWNAEGVRLIEAGRFSDAVAAFVKALEGAPEHATIRNNLAVARGSLGVELLEKGDVAGAERETRAAIEIKPGDPVLHLNLAACLDERGLPQEASAAITRAGELGPRVAPVQAKLGRVRYREGDVKGALAAWAVVLEVEPDNRDVRRLHDRAKRSLEIEAELSYEFSSHFVIHFDMETHAVLASRVLQELEGAHGVLGAELQATARDRLKVVLLTPAQFRESTGTAGWVAGLFDGQIRLPVTDPAENPADLLGRARHEYVHAVLAPLGKRAPSWLHEGLAQLHEKRAVQAARKRLRTTGRMVPFEQMGKSFLHTVSGKQARTLYDTSLCFVSWLREGQRRAGFRAAMQYLYEGDGLLPAFGRGYHKSLPKLYEQFSKNTLH